MDPAPTSPALDRSAERQDPLLDLVGEAARILVVGPVDELRVDALEEAGRTVVTVGARPGDPALEDVELDRDHGELFDAIVVGPALERAPERVPFLERLSALVAEGGCVVVTVPNATHLTSRLRALTGEPDGAGRAAFSRSSLVDLLESSGLVASCWRRVRDDRADAASSPAVPDAVRAWLASDPEATTERFVVRATVARDADLLRSLRLELAEQLAAARRRETELVAELEALRAERRSEDSMQAELETMAAREEELRAMLLDAHDQLMRRDGELARRGRSGKQLQPRLPVVKHRLVTRFPRAAAVYRRARRPL